MELVDAFFTDADNSLLRIEGLLIKGVLPWLFEICASETLLVPLGLCQLVHEANPKETCKTLLSLKERMSEREGLCASLWLRIVRFISPCQE